MFQTQIATYLIWLITYHYHKFLQKKNDAGFMINFGLEFRTIFLIDMKNTSLVVPGHSFTAYKAELPAKSKWPTAALK